MPQTETPVRRTVTIRGQVADRHRPPPRPGRTPYQRTSYRRPVSRPDRVAMWAVLLGIILVLAAATSSHAAILH